MVSTPEKKSQHKRIVNLLDETLIEFVIGNGTTTNTSGNEVLERANGSRGSLTMQVKTNSLGKH